MRMDLFRMRWTRYKGTESARQELRNENVVHLLIYLYSNARMMIYLLYIYVFIYIFSKDNGSCEIEKLLSKLVFAELGATVRSRVLLGVQVFRVVLQIATCLKAAGALPHQVLVCHTDDCCGRGMLCRCCSRGTPMFSPGRTYVYIDILV